MTKRGEQLRLQGEKDFSDGKTIEAFYDIPKIRHNESNRALYEIGYRAAHVEALKSAAKYWKDKHDTLLKEV